MSVADNPSCFCGLFSETKNHVFLCSEVYKWRQLYSFHVLFYLTQDCQIIAWALVLDLAIFFEYV